MSSIKIDKRIVKYRVRKPDEKPAAADAAEPAELMIKGKDGKLEKHPPMGADLVRWMFCRQNPSQNINFGPVPAEEIRARFHRRVGLRPLDELEDDEDREPGQQRVDPVPQNDGIAV